MLSIFRNCRNLLFALLALFLTGPGCEDAGEPGTRAVTYNGTTIHYAIHGSGRPDVLLIHGWGHDRSIWDGTAGELGEHFRVVTPDLPGSGQSVGDRSDRSMRTFAEDIAAVVRELGSTEVVLAGFSMGASVAVEAALLLPNKVKGLILVEGIKDPDMQFPPDMIPQVEQTLMDLVTQPTNEKLVEMGFYAYEEEASFQRYRDMLSRTDPDAWSKSIAEMIRWQNQRCIPALGALSIPVVSVSSQLRVQNDVFVGRYVPDFQFKVIRRAAHFMMWDNPEDFNQVLVNSVEAIMDKQDKALAD